MMIFQLLRSWRGTHLEPFAIAVMMQGAIQLAMVRMEKASLTTELDEARDTWLRTVSDAAENSGVPGWEPPNSGYLLGLGEHAFDPIAYAMRVVRMVVATYPELVRVRMTDYLDDLAFEDDRYVQARTLAMLWNAFNDGTMARGVSTDE